MPGKQHIWSIKDSPRIHWPRRPDLGCAICRLPACAPCSGPGGRRFKPAFSGMSEGNLLIASLWVHAARTFCAAPVGR